LPHEIEAKLMPTADVQDYSRTMARKLNRLGKKRQKRESPAGKKLPD
jgi:hypothetical protein